MLYLRLLALVCIAIVPLGSLAEPRSGGPRNGAQGGGGGGSGGTPDDDSVTDPKMGADDFGDWSCAGTAESCTLDANTVANAEMADNAVGNAEMADNAIGTAEITDGSIQPADLDTDAAFVFNEDGAAVNTRVESDTSANMLCVDGTNNRVGVAYGASCTPGFSLDVNGNIGGVGIFASSTTNAFGILSSAGGLFFEEGTNDVTLRANSQNAASVVSIPSAHSSDTATVVVLNVGTDGTSIALDPGKDNDDNFTLTETALTATSATVNLGAGSATTISVDAGATDPEIDFGSSSIAFDPDDDGSAECTIDQDGLTCTQVETDNNEAVAGGNSVSVLANDATNANLGCANQPSNSYSVTDSDESATDRFDVCLGTTRVSTVGWAPFVMEWAVAAKDPDSGFDNTCLFANTFNLGMASACFDAATPFNSAWIKPAGKNAYLQEAFCVLTSAVGEGAGDVIEVEMIEDTFGGASATELGTGILFTQGGSPSMADGTTVSWASLPRALTAAENGIAMRIQTTDGDAGMSSVSLFCRVAGVVEP